MLKRLEIVGFKSFARKTQLDFANATTAIVGPNGSGKSNVAEAFRFALGEQSMKSMRGKRAEDLIFNGSHAVPRAGRAAVTIVFDNSKRIFNIDFEEVAIERAVLRDGTSEYSINGSKVRLRDVEELLSSANIGETGHHIISQGEADRILLASPRERRDMLEDALGLASYEFKKEEAQRKLSKTDDNIERVQSLRRELAPHVRFLEKQVEKLDRAQSLREELRTSAQTYFRNADAFARIEKERLAAEERHAQERFDAATAALALSEPSAENDQARVRLHGAVTQAEEALQRLQRDRNELSRVIGRTEGALQAAQQPVVATQGGHAVRIPRDDLVALEEAIAQAHDGSDTEALRAAFVSLRGAVQAFLRQHLHAEEQTDTAPAAPDTTELQRQYESLLQRDRDLGEAQEKAQAHLRDAQRALEAHDASGATAREALLAQAQEKAAAEEAQRSVRMQQAQLTERAQVLEQEKREIAVLVGPDALSYAPSEEVDTDPASQEQQRRAIERMKIRLEESGGASEEVRQEYEEATARDAFLERELSDLAQSARGLRTLIADLQAELAKQFAEGLQKVNASFGEFFGLMFGGGTARLLMETPQTDDTESAEESGEPLPGGIDIAVSLPKKKVRSLLQLSGGERALTSIALIFAMSQVNPPPFLILDETDAALDEANSRRYGDMIENLARKSQLIVITHNRETMSRAGILYGVTMSSDGVSKLLSVKFDEAVSVAK